MKKTKLSLVGLAVLLLGGTSMYAQSWRGGGPVTLDKKYAGYHCVNLLDSTSVTVEPPDRDRLPFAGPFRYRHRSVHFSNVS